MASSLRYLPITFDVAGGTVAVAGNGVVTLRKLELLDRTQARVVLFSPAPDAALLAFAATAGVTHIAAYPLLADLEDTTLLFVATGDEAEDTRLAGLARAARVPVNVVDRPALSTFAMPALVERGPLTVAIASDGLAPVLAQRVRALIDAVLPRTFANLGELARSVRSQVLGRLSSNAARRRFWWRVLDGNAGATALSGRMDEARDLALRELDALAIEPLRGKVYLVGAGPGAEDLLTLRAQRLLLSADVIVHDALVPESLVAMGRRDAVRLSVGKTKGRHSVAQADINALLVRLGREGRSVVRLKSGDPLIFGRAGEEMAALREAGIEFEIVPGVTAAMAAAADAAIPLTLRGVASTLTFASGHGADGDDPGPWTATNGTLAFYMGRTAAASIVARLAADGIGYATPVAAIVNAGRPDRRLFAGTLADLPGLANRHDIDGPALILVGPAVAFGDLGRAEPLSVAASLAA